MSTQSIIGIAIDHGYSWMKTKYDDFPTAICAVDEPITSDNILEIDGRYYRACGLRMDVLEDKTSTDDFKLLTYVAIAKYLQHMGKHRATIYLAVGLPIGRLAKEKERFKKYLSTPKAVKYRYEGQTYTIVIEGVLVFPQCYGAVAERIPDMKSDEVVVDIGSWTIDTLRIINHSPDESRCGSDPNGLIPCMRHIDEECMRLYNSKIGENIIREVMISGDADIDEEYVKLITEELTKYTVSVYRVLREMGINVKTTPITFVGGGASLMRRYAGISGKNIHYIEDIRANAIGYDLLLQVYMKSKGIKSEG